MKEKLDELGKELNGIDLVLDKLEEKANVSVFEKLCANCERVFNSFCGLSIVEIVKSGNAKSALDFLNRLKNQVIRLKNYKDTLTAYLEMQQDMQPDMPSVEAINAQAGLIADEVNKAKNLTLMNEEGKAA